jgi:hypothetical protein
MATTTTADIIILFILFFQSQRCPSTFANPPRVSNTLRGLVGWDVLADLRTPHGCHLAPAEDDHMLAIVRSETLRPSHADLLEFPDRVLKVVALEATVAAIRGWEDFLWHVVIILSSSAANDGTEARASASRLRCLVGDLCDSLQVAPRLWFVSEHAAEPITLLPFGAETTAHKVALLRARADGATSVSLVLCASGSAPSTVQYHRIERFHAPVFSGSLREQLRCTHPRFLVPVNSSLEDIARLAVKATV